MDYAKKYEDVIRKVFDCDRWGDPAKQANADNFTDAALREVKIMLGYCTLYMESHLSNKEGIDEECLKLQKEIEKAKTTRDLHSVVETLLKNIK
jgi:hypothetical protein